MSTLQVTTTTNKNKVVTSTELTPSTMLVAVNAQQMQKASEALSIIFLALLVTGVMR